MYKEDDVNTVLEYKYLRDVLKFSILNEVPQITTPDCSSSTVNEGKTWMLKVVCRSK